MLGVVFLIIILMTFCTSNCDKSILFFLNKRSLVLQGEVQSRAVDEYRIFINESEQVIGTENEPIYTLKKPINAQPLSTNAADCLSIVSTFWASFGSCGDWLFKPNKWRKL